ncbi:MAG TPA: GNVR domain-containing protein [Vicinamibacterales bacterium]|nr:GNVR domain-containing protein [Vicinamibacterales bacterium]
MRRGWIVVLAFSIGLAAAPILSKTLPQLYRSETLIRVIPQRVPESYVRSTGTVKMEERIPSISDLLLSRSQLEKIINEFDLYRPQRKQLIMEDIVQRMRAAITLKPDGQETFRIQYVNRDQQTARTVTARLAALFIEENLRDRAGLADETSRFLESQLNDAKERLIQHEKKLEMYRRTHSGELPSQLDSNLQVIRNMQLQLQAVNEATNRVQERRLLVERQIADAQALPADIVTATIDAAGRVEPAPLTTAQQLDAARAQLETARLRYMPDHPDVRAAERTVHDLTAKLERESSRQPQQAAPAAVQQVSPAQVARQKRLRDLQADLEVIDHQLNASLAEEDRLKQTMTDYQRKVDAVPTRESELIELTRDYSTLQATYMSLLTKREDSKIAANLQHREIGEQFRIVDPASLPEKPYNQVQRVAVVASGVVSGLILGLLAIGLLEYRDSSFASEADVVRTLSLPVLAVVPVMGSRQELRRRRLPVIVANVAAAAALIGSGVVLVVWRLSR